MAREIALLTNPAAGRGRATRAAAVALARLRDAGCRVRSLVGGDRAHALALARAAVEDGVDSLVVVGGDGTVALGAQALVGSAVSLGVVPAGTGNDLARSLGLPRTDPVRAADVVVGSRVRRIDLARCGSTYVVTVLAAGFDAAVNRRADTMRWPLGATGGRLRYPLATLAELRDLEPLDYALRLDGRPRRLEAVLVAGGNGPSYGGGLRIAAGAELDDGLLDVVVIGPLSRLELLRTFPRLRSGRHLRHPAVESHRVRSVTLDGPAVTAYADGEPLGPLPVTVEVVPSALGVLVP